mgnify:CR=1 FL=1
MTRINCGYTTGKTIKAKAYTEAGAYRESDITLTETPAGKGLYVGASATGLTVGDNVLVYDILTSNLGPELHGEYEGKVDSNITVGISDIASLASNLVINVAKIVSDIVVIDAVADKIYSDTKIAVSDIIIADAIVDKIYSDTKILVSDLGGMADFSSVSSDVIVVISDLASHDSNLTVLGTTLISDNAYMISDLEAILDDVATQTQEFHI